MKSQRTFHTQNSLKILLFLVFVTGVTANCDTSFAELSWEKMYKYDPESTGPAPKELQELENKKVKIPGFIFPLDFQARTLKEFLFVPSLGACEHVPPPPANLTVFTKMNKAIEFEYGKPVWLTGIFKIKKRKKDPKNPMAGEALYQIDGTRVEDYYPPDPNAPKLEKKEKKNDIHTSQPQK
jgi:hypothetical protein